MSGPQTDQSLHEQCCRATPQSQAARADLLHEAHVVLIKNCFQSGPRRCASSVGKFPATAPAHSDD